MPKPSATFEHSQGTSVVAATWWQKEVQQLLADGKWLELWSHGSTAWQCKTHLSGSVSLLLVTWNLFNLFNKGKNIVSFRSWYWDTVKANKNVEEGQFTHQAPDDSSSKHATRPVPVMSWRSKRKIGFTHSEMCEFFQTKSKEYLYNYVYIYYTFIYIYLSRANAMSKMQWASSIQISNMIRWTILCH